MSDQKRLLVLSGSLALCALVLANFDLVSSLKVSDERLQTIKNHGEEMNHVLVKRESDEKSTTAKPDGPPKKPKGHSHIRHKTSSTTTTKKPKDELKSTTKSSSSKSSTSTTEKPDEEEQESLAQNLEQEAEREKKFWKKIEKKALDNSIRGLKSWMQAMKHLNARTFWPEDVKKLHLLIEKMNGKSEISSELSPKPSMNLM